MTKAGRILCRKFLGNTRIYYKNVIVENSLEPDIIGGLMIKMTIAVNLEEDSIGCAIPGCDIKPLITSEKPGKNKQWRARILKNIIILTSAPWEILLQPDSSDCG